MSYWRQNLKFLEVTIWLKYADAQREWRLRSSLCGLISD
jgi:hypothetical protein